MYKPLNLSTLKLTTPATNLEQLMNPNLLTARPWLLQIKKWTILNLFWKILNYAVLSHNVYVKYRDREI